MVDEAVQPAETTSPEDDLDLSETISAAVDKHRKSEAPAHETIEKEVPSEEEDRPRDEKGRFAAKSEIEAETESAEKPVEPQKVPEGSNVAPDAQKPPAAFSPTLKHKWDKIPEDIRSELVKREADIEKGFARYEGVAAFANLAERNGTTLAAVLNSYNQLENTFVRDPVAAVVDVCRRLNVDPRTLTAALQVQFGGLLEAQPPNLPRPQPNGNGQAYPGLNPEQARELFRQELEARDLKSQVDAFRNDPANKFYDNVREEMAALLNSGLASTLADAYKKACGLNPEVNAILEQEEKIPAPQPKNPAAASQAKAAAKAVGGSPRPGLKSGAAPDSNMSIEDTIRWSINAQRGAI